MAPKWTTPLVPPNAVAAMLQYVDPTMTIQPKVAEAVGLLLDRIAHRLLQQEFSMALSALPHTDIREAEPHPQSELLGNAYANFQLGMLKTDGLLHATPFTALEQSLGLFGPIAPIGYTNKPDLV